jgi:SAM-dependent methyltransferase
VIRCEQCGHGSLAEYPDPGSVTTAYEEAADPVSVREEAGQVETAIRALTDVERFVRPGRLVDVGCWTGSLLAAAVIRGWNPIGVEPSHWAATRAGERGLTVLEGEYPDLDAAPGSVGLVTMCDVLEHLADPGEAVDWAAGVLEPGSGGLFVTVPDAGSWLAGAMGRRWWSVLPMHVQYFTRDSMTRLLEDRGFAVRSVRSHAKVFSARYYAERLGGYNDAVGRLAVGLLERVGQVERPVAPDFHDRMAVIATR